MSEKYNDVFERYSQRLQIATEKHKGKFLEIRDSRKAEKQFMPNSTYVKTAYAKSSPGNDPDKEKKAKKSKYLVPMLNAVGEKVKQDLTANNFKFEYGANTAIGEEIKDAFDEILLKTYTHDNTKKRMNLGHNYNVYSGTMITQTYTEERKEKRINSEGHINEIDLGRSTTFKTYDPLRTLLDWQAMPGSVPETSRFIIVTIGEKSSDWIEKETGKKVSKHIAAKEDSFHGTSSYLTIDGYKKTLEENAGLSHKQGILIREYYEADGYYYVVADDSVILDKRIVSNGIADRIPFNISPLILDPDSPYGRTIWSLLEPHIQVMSTAINMVADNNSIKQKMPFFAVKGVLKAHGVTLNDFSPNEIVELDSTAMAMSGNTGKISIQDLIGKIDIQDVSEGAVFLYNMALEHIWYVTGLNPTTLGGVQQKQIRNESVAGMISQASLRSSSEIVANIENNFMNPTTKDFARIFEMHYEDYPEFEERGITKEDLQDLRNIRIVNGSYLPSDAMTEMQRASHLYTIAQTNQTMDQKKAVQEVMKSMGYPDPERYFLPPLEQLSFIQLAGLIEMIQSNEKDQVLATLAQQAELKQQQAGA